MAKERFLVQLLRENQHFYGLFHLQKKEKKLEKISENQIKNFVMGEG